MTSFAGERVHFLDDQRRNRRRSLRFSVFAVAAVTLAGIPLCVVVSPLLFGVALVLAHGIDLIAPLSPEQWDSMRDVAFALPRVWDRVRGRPVDVEWDTLALLYVLPGAVVMLLAWPFMNLLSRRAGAGLVLRRLASREPDTTVLSERQLANDLEIAAVILSVFQTWGLLALLLETPLDARRRTLVRQFVRLSRDAVRGRADPEEARVMLDTLLGEEPSSSTSSSRTSSRSLQDRRRTGATSFSSRSRSSRPSDSRAPLPSSRSASSPRSCSGHGWLPCGARDGGSRTRQPSSDWSDWQHLGHPWRLEAMARALASSSACVTVFPCGANFGQRSSGGWPRWSVSSC